MCLDLDLDLDLAAENNVQAGLTGGSGYPASVTAGSGRSRAIGGSLLDFWRNAMARLLHAARGLWTRLRLEAMGREESVNQQQSTVSQSNEYGSRREGTTSW
jgi:hypothetical protein